MTNTKDIEQKIKEVLSTIPAEEVAEVRAETDAEIERMMALLNEADEIPF